MLDVVGGTVKKATGVLLSLLTRIAIDRCRLAMVVVGF